MTEKPSSIQGWIVNGVTGANLMLGVTALLAVTLDATAAAAWCLLGCVALDAMDGYLARRWDVSTPIGAQLDSLADMTSFVVASAVLSFYWFWPTIEIPVLFLAGGVYVFGGAFRVARFNAAGEVSTQFQGLPTTAVAALVAVIYLTCPQLNAHYGVAYLVMLGLLMVSDFPYPKGTHMLSYPSWFYAILAVGAVIDVRWTTWIAATAFLLSGPIRWLFARRSRDSRAELVASDPPPPDHPR